MEKEKHKVSKGDLYILNPFVAHEFCADESRKLRVINIMFYVDFFDLSLDANHFIFGAFRNLMKNTKIDENIKFIHLHGDRMQKISELFFNMLNEFLGKEDGYLRVLHNQLSLLLIYIFRDYLNETNKLGNKANNIVPKQVAKQERNVLGKTRYTEEFERDIKSQTLEDPVAQKMDSKALQKAIDHAKREMERAAAELDFMNAAKFRDEMNSLKRVLEKREKNGAE